MSMNIGQTRLGIVFSDEEQHSNKGRGVWVLESYRIYVFPVGSKRLDKIKIRPCRFGNVSVS